VQAYGDAYHLVENAQHVEPAAPFIIKNECGSYVTVKPGPTFQVCCGNFTSFQWFLNARKHLWVMCPVFYSQVDKILCWWQNGCSYYNVAVFRRHLL